MKIFLISNFYPNKEYPDYGIFIKNFRRGLESKDVIFSKFSLIKGKTFGAFQKIKVYLKHYLSITKNYLSKDYDLVYAHFISHNAPILVLMAYFFNNKKPIVINLHGSDVIKYNKGFFGFFNSLILKKTDLLVVPSAYFKEIVLENFSSFLPENIYISPSSGVDLNIFSRISVDYKIKTEALVIGFVSRIELDKGYLDYLTILASLKERGFQIKGVMAGGGSQVENLKKDIKAKGLSNEVQYIGVVSQNKLVELYQSLDVFLFPTKEFESLGLVGIEAMACGIPVVAYNMAGPKTYIENGYNGFLAEPYNVDELESAILKFQKLSDEEKKLLKNNAIKTASNFDSLKIVNDLQVKLKALI